MNPPDSSNKRWLGISAAVVMIYLVLTATGITWFWLLGVVLLVALPVGLSRGQHLRRYAPMLLLILLLAATVMAGLPVLGLVILVTALVFGVASRHIAVQDVVKFVRFGAPGFVGIAGLTVAVVLIAAGLPVIAFVLLAPLVAVLIFWQWRLLRELWNAAG